MRQTISNNLIAQHNELIESFADMSKTCLKLFELIVSQLDSTKEQRTEKKKKNIIFSTLGKNSHKKNSILRKTLKEKGDYEALRKLPRDASSTRLTRRCKVTGRPRGVLRKFEMSRIAFREHAHKGQIPGVKKSSW